MRSPLTKILNNFKNLKNTIPVLMQDISNQNKPELEDFLIFQQRAGKKKSGDIKPKYSPVTVEYKKTHGQEWRHVTLEDEGDFHRGIAVNVDSDGIEFDSTDWKAPSLVHDYGADIMEFNDSTIGEVNKDIFIPELQTKLRQKIGNI